MAKSRRATSTPTGKKKAAAPTKGASAKPHARAKSAKPKTTKPKTTRPKSKSVAKAKVKPKAKLTPKPRAAKKETAAAPTPRKSKTTRSRKTVRQMLDLAAESEALLIDTDEGILLIDVDAPLEPVAEAATRMSVQSRPWVQDLIALLPPDEGRTPVADQPLQVDSAAYESDVEFVPAREEPIEPPLECECAPDIEAASISIEVAEPVADMEAATPEAEAAADTAQDPLVPTFIEIVYEPPQQTFTPEIEAAAELAFEPLPPPFDTPPELYPPLRPTLSVADAPAAGASRPDHAYLQRARSAAQAQAEMLAATKPRLQVKRSALVTLAASILALVGAGALISGNQHAEPGPEEAQASEASPSAAPGADAAALHYASALRFIDAGEMSRGVGELRASANAGFPVAQYRLAKLYERGEGVPRDLSQARNWAERAAHAGNCRAMHDAGVFSARGDGGAVDTAAAFRWFRAAADCGVADSQYNLGILYRQGRGVSADPREALFWFLVAAHNAAHEDVSAFDQALDITAELPTDDVEAARSRARAFHARSPDPAANLES